jgi:hypothetical protein
MRWIESKYTTILFYSNKPSRSKSLLGNQRDPNFPASLDTAKTSSSATSLPPTTRFLHRREGDLQQRVGAPDHDHGQEVLMMSRNVRGHPAQNIRISKFD